MISVLLVSQGRLAEELLNSARTVVGDIGGLTALGVPWEASREEVAELVAAAVDGLDTGAGVLVLSDLHGSTPDQAARSLVASRSISVVAGFNLPMVVRLGCCRPADLDLPQLSAWIEAKGRASILAHLEPAAPGDEACTARPAR